MYKTKVEFGPKQLRLNCEVIPIFFDEQELIYLKQKRITSKNTLEEIRIDHLMK